MPHAGFVHLRVRSAFSLLQSTVRVESPGQGLPGPADAGRGGHRRRQPVRRMQFCAAAKKAGVQPIVGALLALAPLEALPRTPGGSRRPSMLRAAGQGRGRATATCCGC